MRLQTFGARHRSLDISFYLADQPIESSWRNFPGLQILFRSTQKISNGFCLDRAPTCAHYYISTHSAAPSPAFQGGVENRCSGSAPTHFSCEEVFAISSSFFFLLQLLSVLSLLRASAFEMGHSQYKGAGCSCCLILFSKSVVIPTYNPVFFSMM
jgi:hypothetical protein